MKTWVPVTVVAGILACAGAALAAGLDATGAGIFVTIVIVGLAAIAATRKIGRIEPRVCTECGGLLSPDAMRCTHCGASLGSGATSVRTGS